jgi:hypothetical protein
MPVLDGYEATKAIRADPDPHVSSVVIIAMTASAIRGDREKCLEAGMNDYLAKPVRQLVLKSMVDQYLSKSPEEIRRAAREKAMESGTATPEEQVNGVVADAKGAFGHEEGREGPESPTTPMATANGAVKRPASRGKNPNPDPHQGPIRLSELSNASNATNRNASLPPTTPTMTKKEESEDLSPTSTRAVDGVDPENQAPQRVENGIAQ